MELKNRTLSNFADLVQTGELQKIQRPPEGRCGFGYS